MLHSVNTKALDTISATFLALLDTVINDRADIIHVHGIGNALLFPLFRAFGKQVVTAVDGMDWTRAKWNWAERAYLRLALYMAVSWADDVYVDSAEAQRLCQALYGREFRHYRLRDTDSQQRRDADAEEARPGAREVLPVCWAPDPLERGPLSHRRLSAGRDRAPARDRR